MTRIYQKKRKSLRIYADAPVRTGRHAPIAPEIREAVRLLYAGRTLTNVEIGARYGKPANWVNALASKYGWPLRGPLPRAPVVAPKPATVDGTKARRPHARKSAALSIRQYEANRRDDEERRQRTAYGAVLDDANYLRRRGWVVTAIAQGLYLVGNKQLTAAQMVDVAARERRLGAKVAA